MIVYAHRGIDLERPEKLTENSMAAFTWCAQKDFGIELDLQISRDHELLIAHDRDCTRWSEGRVTRLWSELSSAELNKVEACGLPLCRWWQVLELAKTFPKLCLALHLKGENQRPLLINALKKTLLEISPSVRARILIFDLRPAVAIELRQAFPDLALAASVVHEFDIARYQDLTFGTLLTKTELIERKNLYNWAWLDEWDRLDVKEGRKKFYDHMTLAGLRRHSFKSVVISPELHRAEGHEDGLNLKSLDLRWREIQELRPDAICTDYPARFSTLFGV